MFNDDRWHFLLSKLLEQAAEDDIRVIRTLATNRPNHFKIENGKIIVATKRTNFDVFKEVPRDMFERTYNTLEQTPGHNLSQQQISRGINVKRSAFVMAALSLLPEIRYRTDNNSLSIH
mgnify:CR=1 FL=1